MADCGNNKNPLQRSGTARGQRNLPALQPSSAPVMDKTPADWMVWAARLAPHIRYYDTNNEVAGSMEPFFAADVAARLTPIATHRPDALPQFFREQLNILYENDNAANEPLLKQTFSSFFDVVFSYLLAVDQATRQMTEAEAFSFQLKNHVQQLLRPVAGRVIAYQKAAETEGLLDTGHVADFRLFQRPVVSAGVVIGQGLSDIWWPGKPSWSAYYSGIAADPAIFGTVAATPAEKIQHAAHHNFLTGLLDEVSASAAFVIDLSKQALQKVLTDWPNHQPHYALFLAHLHLMEAARDRMNTLTGRHLDFYYDEVLQLRRRPTRPDEAFLSIELNKTVSKWAVKPEHRFQGGTDGAGEPILFQPVRETVLNRAVVRHLMAVYSADAADNLSGVINEGRLFAAPVMHSADGLGAELTTPLKEWHPFYHKTFANGALQSIDMPKAQVGVAVASHYLRLREGERTIRLRLAVSDVNTLTGVLVEAYLTTEKGWLPLSGSFTKGKLADNVTAAAVLSLTISGDQPSITGYLSKAHGHTFATKEPVLKLILPQDDSVAYVYPQLANLTLSTVEVEVQAGEVSGKYNTKGLKNLEVHNDNGLLNPGKPFQPWGPEPTVGNSLIVGSEEVFYKRGATVQLNFEWKDLPTDSGDIDFDSYSGAYNFNTTDTGSGMFAPSSRISVLRRGEWNSLVDKAYVISQSGSSALPNHAEGLPTLGAQAFLDKNDPYPGYGPASTKGYLRIRLNHDFGHRNYRSALTLFLLKKAKDPDASLAEPVPPYQPTLQSLFLSYKADCRSNLSAAAEFDDRPLQFIHLNPFGDAEQHAAITPGPLYLLPHLTESATPQSAGGEFYIGLENVAGGETVALLFQLMEGSENPLRDKPEPHLSWFYLSKNNWKPLPDDALGDGTAELIQSGIIDVAVPTDATTTDTWMPTGFVWLKANVTQAPDAVAKIIGVHPNAVQVVRSAGQTASVSLPAGTIAKLQTPDPAVKKVTQPYATFGGRAVEPSADFYVRASERLRHKDRAITIWDYERLVLEAFPEIYKVKCLNHTNISGSVSGGDLEYNEVAPGHVTLITIPDLRQRNDADPLKPYTRKSLLRRIETFLRARTSCHVRLSAAQPQFEEVRVACTVVLAEGYADLLYYRERLQQEVTQFLSPWAYGQTTDVEFGGRMSKSVLIDFIEERPYVDYLTDFRLYHTPGEGAPESGDVEEAVASTARSILVSAAATRHDFTMIAHTSIPTPPVVCPDE